MPPRFDLFFENEPLIQRRANHRNLPTEATSRFRFGISDPIINLCPAAHNLQAEVGCGSIADASAGLLPIPDFGDRRLPSERSPLRSLVS